MPKVRNIVNGKVKRKTIPVGVWMTEEFRVVPRIGWVRSHQQNRLAGAHPWHKIYAARPRRIFIR